MAGRIRDEDIALVRERSPIADVVGDYLQLQNAGGGSLKGLCPFHDEKSPSFNITPQRGLYYCFGCGEGGDVIAFIQAIEHVSFVEAVESLARRSGVQLRYEQGGYVPRNEQGQRQRLIEAHKAAAEFYAEQLLAPGAAEGRRFLTERGFTRADSEQFGVGFAPPGWESLTSHLRHKGFSDAEIILAGLAAQGRRGPYDKFRNRLLWPVREVTGEVVGFGARKLDPEDDGPKYLNTQETPVFKKSHLLYGLDLAKRAIARERQAVIVEGYTDVMACHLAGVGTAVATCGTSFGEEHMKMIRRLLLGRSSVGGEVVFTFDGDAAGQKAALRAFESEGGFASDTFVAVQPDGLDPCDLRIQKGDAAVRDLIDAKRPLYVFALRSKIAEFNLGTHEGQLAALDAAAPIVATIRDAGLRKRYQIDLDKWIGLNDEAFVRGRVEQHMGDRRQGRGGYRPPAPARPTAATAAAYDLRDASLQRERQALKIAVQFPGLAAGFDELDPETFSVPQHRAVHEIIRNQGGVAAAGEPDQWARRLWESAPNDTQKSFVNALGVEQIEVYGELNEHSAREILGTIRIHSINRKVANLKTALQRLDPVADEAEYQRAFADLMAVEQQKRLMRDRIDGAF
ncbi:DNA primase [Murinocardiopsis flavida]|uniref:DNA primase n=1 Tax=Murinocardiopsis flavida TaxID=645275 RepID=A0A2P8D2C9_9ACTN|nr:DNA primase [Murinocardiopsis flavida]PSK91367.1 DNA primase [Murinocardiopsis flavida]